MIKISDGKPLFACYCRIFGEFPLSSSSSSLSSSTSIEKTICVFIYFACFCLFCFFFYFGRVRARTSYGMRC